VRHEHAISQDVADPGVLRSPFWGQGVCRDPCCVYRCSRDDLVKGDREARRAGYAQALQVDNTIDTPAGVARFAVICFVPSTIISATVGVGSLSLAGYADWSEVCYDYPDNPSDAGGSTPDSPVQVNQARADGVSADQLQARESRVVSLDQRESMGGSQL